MNGGEGFELFVSGLSPTYAVQQTHHTTITDLLNVEYIKVQDAVTATLKKLYLASAGEPFCSYEIDMTTTANTAYCTMSGNYISAEWVYERVNLCTREFPLDHKAVQVAAWVQQVAKEWFSSFMPPGYQLADIFVAGTVEPIVTSIFTAVSYIAVATAAAAAAAHITNAPFKLSPHNPFSQQQLSLLRSMAQQQP